MQQTTLKPNVNALACISPIDGRYQNQTQELQPIFSEEALIRHRVAVEVAWLTRMITTIRHPAKKHALSTSALDFLAAIAEHFSAEDTTRVKLIEKETNHDMKAVEYFIKEKIADHPELRPYQELIHIGCTSDDSSNLAYALMLKDARDKHLLPPLQKIVATLTGLAKQHAATPMLAHTHGQPATPTTVGKELANFVARLVPQYNKIAAAPIMGKFNGATGNYNAIYAAFPEHDWCAISQEFVTSFGLTFNAYTTQIEPHDYIVEMCHLLAHTNTILLDLCRDMWGYVALNYFKLKVMTRKEIGSSTMPHKVNPIDFENSEGNLGLANSLLYHFAQKLPISRWQRDLSDSTVMRSIGSAFAYNLIAYKALLKGLDKLDVNYEQLEQDLEQHWEVLAEAIQTTLRRHGIANPYEQLKALTHGKKIDAAAMHKFINNLDIAKELKQQLLQLTPRSYIGKAAELAKNVGKL
jgi:adenylosuccinate lyase